MQRESRKDVRVAKGSIAIAFGLGILFFVLQTQVKEMPLYCAVLGYICSGFLLLYGVAWFFAPLRQLRDNIKRIRFRSPIFVHEYIDSKKGKTTEEHKQVNDWIIDVLQNDRDKLSERIVSKAREAIFDKIESNEPNIEVIVELTNMAVFPVEIAGINGSLDIDGTLCNAPVDKGRKNWIAHGNTVNIRIKQAISERMARALLKKSYNSEIVTIAFGKCTFVVQPKEPGYNMKTIEVTVSKPYQQIINKMPS